MSLNVMYMRQFTRNRCRGCLLFLETFMSVPSLTNICQTKQHTVEGKKNSIRKTILDGKHTALDSVRDPGFFTSVF